MILHVDIVGIGNKKVDTPKFQMETLDEYILIAKKMIASMAPSFRYGLAEEMLCSDDAISNVAHDIMVADWQFNGRGNRYGFRKERAKYSIKSYLSRRGKHNKRRVFRLDAVVKASNQDSTFAELLTDNSQNPIGVVEDNDLSSYIIQKLDSMVSNGTLSSRGVRYIKMYYLDSLDVNKIAEKEGVTRQAVYDTMSRTMKIIKNSFKEQLI